MADMKMRDAFEMAIEVAAGKIGFDQAIAQLSEWYGRNADEVLIGELGHVEASLGIEINWDAL